ncbi:hypothetical protein EOM86_14715 [Candidatus Nomurabacteria bacterium]|nr:hypothetical protein [Candidatus Nomurabacteria bacterium]
MAKRKQYMFTAEEALMSVYRAYFAEHGDIPSSPAVIKAAMTKAHNAFHARVSEAARKKFGKGYYNNPNYFDELDQIKREMLC